jgi:hypothetical protein
MIIINGKGGSGKDTFVEFVQDHLQERNICCGNVSSVREIKTIATDYFGWNGEKTTFWRRLLSDLKDLQTQSNDGPYRFLLKQWAWHLDQGCSCFFHIREPEEIERFKNTTNAMTLLICRDTGIEEYGNRGDDEVDDYEYDVVIHNNGTLDELRLLALDFSNRYYL